MFSKTLKTGSLPKRWEKGNVVPILEKKGDRQEALNNRQLSLTSIQCKVLEKVIRCSTILKVIRMVKHLQRSTIVTQ